ncbi:hypothetical protein SAMN05421504_11558 [Amycolatopsis xylanica]|uniref:Uncharacterized protein n=1 Tax=Amycolatopsis xylanica TaxID=589385 RepID=A0A1H3SRM6_9PSEU|nr:hypothetical protein SAMN05421504_11558 [Amycolatopsis xylanica]
MARSLTFAGIDADTLMVKALRPDSALRYLRAEISAGVEAVPFDWRLVGGSVSRQQDTTHLVSPGDFVRAFGLGYPDSPFGTDPVSVQTMEFRAVDVERFVLPLGAPTQPYPEFGYPPNQGAVRAAASAMTDAAREAGIDPNMIREELNPWPFTGIGLTADSELRIPEYWMRFSQIPASATIYDHSGGVKTAVGVYRSAALGWEDLR